jgi:glycosyltransferase A (GT-A) superfamily protein (DUF2064 family)
MTRARTALLNRAWTCDPRGRGCSAPSVGPGAGGSTAPGRRRPGVQFVVVDDLPGQAHLRSRLSPPYSIEQAGLLADAAIADTLRAVDATPAARRVAADGPSLFVRTETPQVSASLLDRCAATLGEFDAVLGPTTGDTWWAFGLRAPDMSTDLGVAMWSMTDVASLTLLALRLGLRVAMLPVLQTVHTAADAHAVAERCPPGSRFAAAVAGLPG